MIKSGKPAQPAQLMTYPGYGFVKNGEWRLFITGIAYTTPDDFNMGKRLVIRMLRSAMSVTPEQTDCDMFRSRVAPFMADGGKRLAINLEIGKRQIRLRKKTKRSGRFATLIRLSLDEVERAAEKLPCGKRLIRYRVYTEHPGSPIVEGVVHLLDPTGLSVISDIDDTIKITSVANKRELLFNTFMREFKSVDGMPELYQRWSETGVDFHYVSSSPWQLFHPLFQMQQQEGFPAGTLHLRKYKISDQIFKRVPIFRTQGKVSAIKRLMKHLPQRKFIMIGDSGEKDPEIYCKAGEKNPGRVAGVFIRDLADKPLASERIRKLNSKSGVNCIKYTCADELHDLAAPILDSN